MPLGPGYFDAHNIYHIGEDDNEGTWSDLLGLISQSVSNAVAVIRSRLVSLEIDSTAIVSRLATGLVARATYTPTLTNVNLGTGGTLIASYRVTNGIVQCRATVTFGSGGGISGRPVLSLPTGRAAARDADGAAGAASIGTSRYPLMYRVTASNSLAAFYLINASGTYAVTGEFASGVPAAVTAGNQLLLEYEYELAP